MEMTGPKSEKNDKILEDIIQIKTPLNKKSWSHNMSMNDIVGLAWGAKEILRDDFKKT